MGEDEILNFLNSQTDIPVYELTEDDRNLLKNQGMAEYLFQKITRPQFRRSAIDNATILNTREKIENHLKKGEPITFTQPFGAYKNWQLWSYPEPDWAEVFNLNYMARYLSPIVAAYSPGIIFNYSYGDSVMDIVSNMPESDTDKYTKVFKSLISYFQDFVPQNFKFECVRINEFYSSKEEHKNELRAIYEDNTRNWETSHTAEDREKRIRSARRNLMLQGVDDLTKLSESELEKRFLQAAMWCDAHDRLEKRRKFNKYSTNIEIVFVRGPSLALHIGSCDTSSFHFWVGTGVVEKNGERLLQRIFSQKSLNDLFSQNMVVQIEVDTIFTGFSDNFKKVIIVENVKP